MIKTPFVSLTHARALLADWMFDYNTARLHGAIGSVPASRLCHTQRSRNAPGRVAVLTRGLHRLREVADIAVAALGNPPQSILATARMALRCEPEPGGELAAERNAETSLTALTMARAVIGSPPGMKARSRLTAFVRRNLRDGVVEIADRSQSDIGFACNYKSGRVILFVGSF